MAIILQDSFDAEPSPIPTLTNWTVFTQPIREAFATITPGATGAGKAITCTCLLGNTSAQFAYIQKTFAAVNEVRCRAYIGITSPPAELDGSPIDVRAAEPTGYGLAWTYISPAGLMSLRYNTTVNSRQTAVGSTQLVPNVWYLTEVRVKVNTATTAPFNGFVELWVNGVLVASAYAIDNSPVGQASIAQFGLRYIAANTTADMTVGIDEISIESVEPTGTWTLTLVQSTGGTISSPKTIYNNGEIATITATANPDTKFDHWLIDGTRPAPPTDITNPASAPMYANHTLEAVFVTGGGGTPLFVYVIGGLVAFGLVAILAFKRK